MQRNRFAGAQELLRSKAAGRPHLPCPGPKSTWPLCRFRLGSRAAACTPSQQTRLPRACGPQLTASGPPPRRAAAGPFRHVRPGSDGRSACRRRHRSRGALCHAMAGPSASQRGARRRRRWRWRQQQRPGTNSTAVRRTRRTVLGGGRRARESDEPAGPGISSFGPTAQRRGGGRRGGDGPLGGCPAGMGRQLAGPGRRRTTAAEGRLGRYERCRDADTCWRR